MAGGALLARVAAALTVGTLLVCLFTAKRLSRAHVGMLLFGCALSAEWAFSLRSQEIVGFDITTELHIAQHVQTVGVWHTSHRGDAYGAMLSVTVLPSTLSALTGCSPLIVFKVLYPVLTALLPVSVFVVGERIMSRAYAAGAAALLIVESYFFQQLPELARQELALLFFAALVSALCDPYIRPRSRLPLVSALAAGLVVSHYSTTYLAMPAVVLALIVGVAISKLRRLPLMSAELLCAAAVLAGGAVIWYGAVTHSTSNLTLLVTSLEQRGVDPLPNHQGNVVAGYLNGNVVESVSGPRFERLAVRDYQRTAPYVVPLLSASEPRYRLRSASVPVPAVRHPALARAVNLLTVVVAELMLLFGVIGAVVMMASRRTPQLTTRIGILAFGTVAMLALIRISGTVAANYNQTRALLQSLILLALPAAWMAERLVHQLRRFRPIAIVTSAVMVLAITGVFAAISD